MDKIDNYIERVCRSIGGPKSLRLHVRQELREHLLDAVAQHKAAGLSEEAAVDKALEEFGQPEVVRSELEATHGHRVMAVVIDRAMQWKEMTMRPKWLWATWAYLAVVGVIGVELFFIVCTNLYLLPKMQRIRSDGLLIFDDNTWPAVSRMFSFLDHLQWVCERLGWWLLLLTAVLWGLFEWRVRSENKSSIRLAALGTAALGLMVVVLFTASSLELPFMVGLPPMVREQHQKNARGWIDRIDTSVRSLEQARAKKDWEEMSKQRYRAAEALEELGRTVPSLAAQARPEQPTGAELQAQVQAASESLREAKQAILDMNAERLEAALKKFHQAFEPVQEAAKRSQR